MRRDQVTEIVLALDSKDSAYFDGAVATIATLSGKLFNHRMLKKCLVYRSAYALDCWMDNHGFTN